MIRVDEPEQLSHVKQVGIVMNGHPDKAFSLQYRHQLTKAEIIKNCQARWGPKYSKGLRLFNHEGVEFEAEDLKYVKNNDFLYVSKGQQFDAHSSYGQYEVVRHLGEGGFGKVSLARHRTTGQLVAIKVMKAQRVRNAHEIDVVFRQVENLKALNHPNIVKIYKSYTLSGMSVVLIMEYLEGGQFLQLIKGRGRLDLEEALRYLKQIVSAIEYCHSKNIVHRDLKMENLLLKSRNSKEVKVADFGISGVAEQFNPDVDTGTLKYMSPEVLSGVEKGNSTAVDVWSMGCIFYYMLFGKLPFIGKTSAETIKLIIQGRYHIPKDVPVDEGALQLLSRMLQVNPKHRIKTGSICEDIKLLLHQLMRPMKTEQDLPTEKSEEITNRNESINPGKPRKQLPPKRNKVGSLLPMIPKRLEKQKDMIENELREYRNRKKGNERSLLRSYETKSTISRKPLLRDRSVANQGSIEVNRLRSRQSLSEMKKFQ